MGMLISIDNGGTLTDACVISGDKVFHAKTLTTPHDLTECFVEALREVSKRIYGEPQLTKLLEEVDYIRYSTTQGTNAVVQRKGPRLGLIVRKGQKVDDLNKNEGEADLFKALVGERVSYLDLSKKQEEIENDVINAVNELMSRGANRVIVSLGGKTLAEDENRVKRITLLRYPRHLLGAVPILYSHQLSDDSNDSRRTWSSLLNSFLHPAMERFLYNAEGVLREARAKNPLLIFGNDGTSSRVAKTVALKTWGSGPRGGMEGAKALAKHYGRKALVTMDIGGTTTDIGIVNQGLVSESRWGSLEDVNISFPLCELESLGAGGSSIFKVVNGKVQVGPESVGGAPGPACFGYGGKMATITDAYLLLGILDGDSYFGGALKLDKERAKAAVMENIGKPLNVDLDKALEAMEEAYIDKIAKAMGHFVKDAKETSMLAFGGAGPMSACKVAEKLALKEIIVPRMAAVFSAFGIGFSDIAHIYDAGVPDTSDAGVTKSFEALNSKATRDMYAEGFDLADCKLERSVNYSAGGKDVSEAVTGTKLSDGAKKSQDLRVSMRATKVIPHFSLLKADTAKGAEAKSSKNRTVRGKALPLYKHEDLKAGQWAAGPCVVEEEYFTCLVTDGWSFIINDNRDVVLSKKG